MDTDCDPYCYLTGSDPDEPCIEAEGVCTCLPGYTGPTCADCDLNHFLSGGECIGCNCNVFGKYVEDWKTFQGIGINSLQCEDETGDCGPCHPGFTGLKCDICDTDFNDYYSLDFDLYGGYQYVFCLKGRYLGFISILSSLCKLTCTNLAILR